LFSKLQLENLYVCCLIWVSIWWQEGPQFNIWCLAIPVGDLSACHIDRIPALAPVHCTTQKLRPSPTFSVSSFIIITATWLAYCSVKLSAREAPSIGTFKRCL